MTLAILHDNVSGFLARAARCHFPALLLAGLLSFLSLAAGDETGSLGDAQNACAMGDFSLAAKESRRALEFYRRQGDSQRAIRAAVVLAEALRGLGRQRESAQVLEEALSQAEAAGAAPFVSAVKSRLGAALTLTRDTERAALMLNQALEGAKGLNDGGLEASVLNDLGNLLLTQGKLREALAAYQASADLAGRQGEPILAAQALCNAAASAVRSGEHATADEMNTRALDQLASLAPSHIKGFLLISSGQTDRQIKPSGPEPAARWLLRAHASFQRALELARQLGDRNLETWSLGFLAQLYEQDGQADAALALLRQAVFTAQQAQLPEALYRWEWQEGRLLRAKGSSDQAIEAYRRAVRTLEPIRIDVSLGFGNTGPQRSFRDTQGPLFYELADLLLSKAESETEPGRHQALLREARDTVGHLKAVELNDYFCDECVDLQKSRTRAVEALDKQTAVLYLIPLPTRTEVLVGLSTGLKRIRVDVGAAELTAEVMQFRRNLETRTSFGYLAQAQRLYDWLVRPLRPVLSEHGVDTLVLVPDGALRTIPFAALHDGERFLIQDLAVAVAPGLSLVEPQSTARRKTRMLLSGLSESVQGFPALDFVPAEVKDLEALYSSETLFNSDFTLEKLGRKFAEEQFSIVHIASHGQFSRDVRNTFVLTYENKLTLNALEAMIRPSQYRGQPVELLVLSACQTAAGDDRAALGLAGVAVKAGARSALASLWFVNDQSTSALVSEVHRQLRNSPSLTKARALQAAQVKLLGDRRYRHPCYWSPFLIIGNWL